MNKNNIIMPLTILGFLIFGLIFLYSLNEKELETKMIPFAKGVVLEEVEIVLEQHLYDITAQEPSELKNKFSKKSSERYKRLIIEQFLNILYPEIKIDKANSKNLTEKEKRLENFISGLEEKILERILDGAFARKDLSEMLREKTDMTLSRMKLFIRMYSISTSLLFLFIGIIFLKSVNKRKQLLVPFILLMISVLFLFIQYFYSIEWFFKAIIDESLAMIFIFYYIVIATFLLLMTLIKKAD